MKIIISALIILVLSACGPSELEKEQNATVACNIMGESAVVDGASRIKEVNLAREKNKSAIFLGKDSEIQEAFEYGLCEEFVLDEENYAQLLDDAKIAYEQEVGAVEAQIAILEAEIKANEAEFKAKEEKLAAEKALERRKNNCVSGTYISLEQPFVTNVQNSHKVTQISLAFRVQVKCDDKYDPLYSDFGPALSPIRVAVQQRLGTITEEQLREPTFRQKLASDLTLAVNNVLQSNPTLGISAEETYFTGFVVQ